MRSEIDQKPMRKTIPAAAVRAMDESPVTVALAPPVTPCALSPSPPVVPVGLEVPELETAVMTARLLVDLSPTEVKAPPPAVEDAPKAVEVKKTEPLLDALPEGREIELPPVALAPPVMVSEVRGTPASLQLFSYSGKRSLLERFSGLKS